MIAAAVTLVVLPALRVEGGLLRRRPPALVAAVDPARGPGVPDLARGARKPRAAPPSPAMWRPETPLESVVATPHEAPAACFGYWGLFTWIPGYLRFSSEAHGRRRPRLVASLVAPSCPGKWLRFPTPCSAFGADALVARLELRHLPRGRRRRWWPVFFVPCRALAWLLVLGPSGFFGHRLLLGLRAVGSSLFPHQRSAPPPWA